MLLEDGNRLGYILFENWHKKFNDVVDMITSLIVCDEEKVRNMKEVKDFTDKVCEGKRIVKKKDEVKTEDLRGFMCEYYDTFFNMFLKVINMSHNDMKKEKMIDELRDVAIGE